MFVNLILGCVTVFITMIIQVTAVVLMIRYLLKKLAQHQPGTTGLGFDTYIISVIMLMLFFGHLIQIVIWAELFIYLDQFDDRPTAFYHSAVNFASLGYGDIVMSEKWRLLGALEASNGVLMFGLSAGAMLSVMLNIFARHSEFNLPKHDKTEG